MAQDSIARNHSGLRRRFAYITVLAQKWLLALSVLMPLGAIASHDKPVLLVLAEPFSLDLQQRVQDACYADGWAICMSVGWAPNACSHYYDEQGITNGVSWAGYRASNFSGLVNVRAYYCPVTGFGSCPQGFDLRGDRCVEAPQPPLDVDPTPLRDLGPEQCNINPGTQTGNPHHIGTGNKYQREVDYAGQGALPLRFERHYNSVRGAWRQSYGSRLLNVSSDAIQAQRADGKSLDYALVGGIWQGASDDPHELVDIGGGQLELRRADAIRERYDATTGRLQSLHNQAGQSITLGYDADERLVTVTHFSGRTLQLLRDADGRLIGLIDPAGAEIDYVYDSEGRLTEVRYPDASGPVSRLYHYENADHPQALTGITDERGERIATWYYDADGRVIESERGAGSGQVLVTETGAGTVSVVNALGRESIYHLTEINGITRITQIDGQPATFCGATTRALTYDAQGFVASRTDENGHVTLYSYNERGLLEMLTEAAGSAEERTTSTTWHPDFPVPLQVVRPGQTVDYTYDSAGRRLTRTVTDTQTQTEPYVTTGNTRTTTWSYNALGLVATMEGPRTDVADVTHYEYDANGDLLRTTDALGHVTEIISRDAHGHPTRVRDPNGVDTVLTYDGRGRLVSRSIESAQGPATTGFSYDGTGLLLGVTLPAGETLSYEYDAAQRLVAIENGLGERVEYTLDAAGNHVAEVIRDPAGNVHRQHERLFDELSRLIQDIGASGQTTDFGYDGFGNQVSIVDGEGNLTTQAFDALHRLVRVTDALDQDASYVYDARDNLIEVTDPAGVITTYVYDGLDNLIQETSTASGVTVYHHDAAGNVTQRIDARGVVSTTGYDALGRPLTTSYSGAPGETVTFSYDHAADGHPGIGRLTGISDASGSTTLRYDDRGNVILELRVIDGAAFTTEYAYDLV